MTSQNLQRILKKFSNLRESSNFSKIFQTAQSQIFHRTLRFLREFYNFSKICETSQRILKLLDTKKVIYIKIPKIAFCTITTITKLPLKFFINHLKLDIFSLFIMVGRQLTKQYRRHKTSHYMKVSKKNIILRTYCCQNPFILINIEPYVKLE